MVQENSLKNKERIIVIAGPTGIGKSAYAIEVAKKHGGEVVSADSVQIYRGLDIGSGKVTQAEMQGIPHHMIDIIEPYQQFTVVDFIKETRGIISDIIDRGKLPIVVGGTGFYINALLHGYNCGSSEPDEKLREKLNALERKNYDGYLHEMLSQIAPDTGVMKNDTVRTIRKLELLLKPVFDAYSTPDYDDVYDALLVVLDADRAKLDEFADIRIRSMIANGFIEEVKRLKIFHETRVLNSVGYREIKYYVKNMDSVTLEETIDEMKQSYHALIKKQQTFFRWMKWDNKVVSNGADRSDADAAIKIFLES